jgi:hypothetical protein
LWFFDKNSGIKKKGDYCIMQIDDLNKGLSSLLSVNAPWKITSINTQPKNKVVDIFIGFIRGSEFQCPCCQKSCKVHDSTEHRIRHLDWFEHRCYLNVRVPRTRCSEHGVKVIESLPWASTSGHFSFFLKKK